jgi:hypothetical protein
MHIFLLRGDLLYSIVLMVVSTNYLFFAGQRVHRTSYPKTLGKTLGREFAVYPQYHTMPSVAWTMGR